MLWMSSELSRWEENGCWSVVAVLIMAEALARKQSDDHHHTNTAVMKAAVVTQHDDVASLPPLGNGNNKCILEINMVSFFSMCDQNWTLLLNKWLILIYIRYLTNSQIRIQTKFMCHAAFKSNCVCLNFLLHHLLTLDILILLYLCRVELCDFPLEASCWVALITEWN